MQLFCGPVDRLRSSGKLHIAAVTTMNLHEYAKHRKARGLKGCTHVAVHYAIRDNRLSTAAKRAEDGRTWEIDPDIADIEWEQNKVQNIRAAAAGEPTGSMPSLVKAECEKRRAQADMLMLSLQVRQGQLIEASKIRPLIFQRHRQFRDAVQNLPVRVVDSIAAIIGDLDTDKRHAIRTLVSTECRRVLEDLAKNPILEPPAEPEPAAAAG